LVRGEFGERRNAGEHLGLQAARGDAVGERARRVDVGERRVARREAQALLVERVDLALRSEREDAVAAGMTRDDVERAAADRTGGAEDRERLHGADYPSSRCSSTAAGITGTSASMRSSTPPCPGSTVPLSLTPAWRLSSDSCRSPTIDKA